MNLRKKYHKLFQKTKYLVYCNNKIYNIQINKNNKWIDKCLTGKKGWTLITAFNPLPKILSQEENIKRNKDLETLIKKAGLIYYNAKGIGNNDWVEDSFLILNISKRKAIELGNKYSQLAIIYGIKSNPAKILFLVPG